MGIRYLNKFLRENCLQSIQCKSIASFSGKKIAIDTSIYLYRYETDNTLLESMYLLMSIFKNYNIIPLFVFDGKPPPEKKLLIEQRVSDRQTAEKEIKQLEYMLQHTDDDNKLDLMELTELKESIETLKKKTVYVTRNKINKVKELIHYYGASYIEAEGEADELCAILAIQNKVWAVLSEDMDMFVYGCPRVLRYFSLINHTAVLYQTDKILNDLNMNQDDFRSICIVSGTDYNCSHLSPNTNLFHILKYFKKYNSTKTTNTFYEWLQENTDCEIDIPLLNKINRMFTISKKNTQLENIKIISCPIQYKELKLLLNEDGFIFA
jgi:5'-3' exonuclease